VRARLPPGDDDDVQEWVANLGDPGAPVALPHAAVPLLGPRHSCCWTSDPRTPSFSPP
jgi:hypothetical protein